MSHDGWEYSEDRKRGDLPHIRAVVQAMRRRLDTACSRCRTRQATYIVDPYQMPRAVCTRCYSEWVGLTPIGRQQARLEFVNRGRR